MGTLPEMFDVEDVGLEDDAFLHFTFSNISQFVQRPNDLRLITEFLQEARKNHPEKMQLTANAQAIESVIVDESAFILYALYWTFGPSGQCVSAHGAGSIPMPCQVFHNTNWNVGLHMTYPLFDGNRRHINLQKGRIQTDRIHLQLKKLDNNLALNVKAKTIGLLTASTNLEFSRASAVNAGKNYALVENSYMEGATSIITLLDAQKVALASKLAHSNSVYTYLSRCLELENSIGRFHMLASDKEKQGYKKRLEQFLEAHEIGRY